ncbi:L,D-transpeptidase family protein [Bradyrhizobium sp. LHD-71]|uniref:L,D-transpeptidase n=1 Tax=Bradyrhizobium sp. LHD-71 TaxID=3072141 RepID=UPI00280E4511|nr:L,D-transpeptidase family protein [Bradyrhizobium sp. LHD-71]MDQ8727762.1 L,D-transpeptidase family protein [Bradyrhizobium sp. LHD-71]
MAQRKFVVLAVLAAAGMTASSVSHAQVYAPPQHYSATEPYRGQSAPPPNFDAFGDEDDDDIGSIATPAPGPVLSPNDPRYGRPMGPPPVIYSDRPSGPPPLYSDRGPPAGSAVQDAMRPPAGVSGQGAAPGAARDPSRPATTLAALPPEDQPEVGAPKELPPHLKRQEVYYATKEPAGTIVVDTANTHLYLVLGGNRAIRYGVRVGRDGFTWEGVQKITRKAEWPDWHPPTEMIERQPYLPRFMAGGDGNPLGARAMYLGNTVYRIHGTNQPSTIGQFVSSGCVGMLNEDVTDLFDRVKVGTRVVVLPGNKSTPVAAAQVPTNLAPPGGQQSYPPTSYVPPAGAQPASGQPQVYRGDARSDATTVQPLPPPLTIR